MKLVVELDSTKGHFFEENLVLQLNHHVALAASLQEHESTRLQSEVLSSPRSAALNLSLLRRLLLRQCAF